jgi:hypothetical protein
MQWDPNSDKNAEKEYGYIQLVGDSHIADEHRRTPCDPALNNTHHPFAKYRGRNGTAETEDEAKWMQEPGHG